MSLFQGARCRPCDYARACRRTSYALVLVALCALALLVFGCSAAPSEQDGSGLAVPSSPVNVEARERLAVEGYDVVSYFEGSPQRGSKVFAVADDGVYYWFATAVHRDTFLKDPGKYKPAYGGWCATAMTNGDRVDVEPTNYRVTDGRLYVFFKLAFIDASGAWDDDPQALRERADREWAKMITAKGTGL